MASEGIGETSVENNAELFSYGDRPMSSSSVAHRWHIGRAPTGDRSGIAAHRKGIGRFCGQMKCLISADHRPAIGRYPADNRTMLGRLSYDD